MQGWFKHGSILGGNIPCCRVSSQWQSTRYAYAENDPINKSDPNGHVVAETAGRGLFGGLLDAIGGLFASSSGRVAGAAVAGPVGVGIGAAMAVLTPTPVANAECPCVLQEEDDNGGGSEPPAAQDNSGTAATPPDPDDEESSRKTKHAQLRAEEGRKTNAAFQDAQRARRADVFYDNINKTYGVRGPKGREHYFSPETGKNITSLNRSNAAFQARMRSGTTRPTTQQEFDHFRSLLR